MPGKKSDVVMPVTQVDEYSETESNGVAPVKRGRGRPRKSDAPTVTRELTPLEAARAAVTETEKAEIRAEHAVEAAQAKVKEAMAAFEVAKQSAADAFDYYVELKRGTR